MGIGRGFTNVTLSDTVDVAKDTSGSYPDAARFGTGGTAVIVGIDGSEATFTNIADGETIAVSFKRIKSTGSSGVADIVGIYL